MKFGEILRFSNSKQDVISFIKFHRWALLVCIPSLGSPGVFHPSFDFPADFIQGFPQVFHVFFQFSSDIGQSQILFASDQILQTAGWTRPGLSWSWEWHNLLETEKVNDSTQTESQEVKVTLGQIPCAIQTKGTWKVSECRYWLFQLFHWPRVRRLSSHVVDWQDFIEFLNDFVLKMRSLVTHMH